MKTSHLDRDELVALVHRQEDEIDGLRIALKEMLVAFSMENIGLDASARRLGAKKQARAALSETV